MIGRRIGHYEILELLGRGGMGVVYRAQDILLGRTVALKFLAHEGSPTFQNQDRLLSEARAASKLNHPCIATLHEIVSEGDDTFLVFEYLPKGTLRARLDSRDGGAAGLPLEEVLRHGIEMAEGLSHAHGQGLVHRDVKPENLMFSAEGTLKVMDFGLARSTAAEGITTTGGLVGTPAYMSPEQLLAQPLTAATDVFSAGVVLFELATNRLPFVGDQPLAVATAIVNQPPRPLASLRPDLPPTLVELIHECLEKDPRRRPSSAAELARRLRLLAGDSREREATPGGRRAAVRASLAGALAFVAISSVSILISMRAGADSSDAGPPSVAVLTFENLSGSGELDRFAAGLSEEISGELSRLPGVLVASRTAVRGGLDASMTPEEIGESLRVAYFLEGSLRANGPNLRIACRLVDTSEGFHLWTESFDRQRGDDLALQSEVAREVAARIGSRLRQARVKSPVRNAGAAGSGE